jgi:hypothetical protein
LHRVARAERCARDELAPVDGFLQRRARGRLHCVLGSGYVLPNVSGPPMSTRGFFCTCTCGGIRCADGTILLPMLGGVSVGARSPRLAFCGGMRPQVAAALQAATHAGSPQLASLQLAARALASSNELAMAVPTERTTSATVARRTAWVPLAMKLLVAGAGAGEARPRARG